jgi:hypothetical protein
MFSLPIPPLHSREGASLVDSRIALLEAEFLSEHEQLVERVFKTNKRELDLNCHEALDRVPDQAVKLKEAIAIRDEKKHRRRDRCERAQGGESVGPVSRRRGCEGMGFAGSVGDLPRRNHADRDACASRALSRSKGRLGGEGRWGHGVVRGWRSGDHHYQRVRRFFP